LKSLLNIDEGDAKCGKGLSNYYFLRWIHNTDFSMGSAVKPKNPHIRGRPFLLTGRGKS